MSLDGKLKFRKLYIDNVDSTSILDSLRMTGRVLNTRNYDFYITRKEAGDCEVVYQFQPSIINTNTIKEGTNYYITHSWKFHTILGKPGKLWVNLVGVRYFKDSLSAPSTNYYEYPVSFYIANTCDVKMNTDTLTLTSYHQGREINLLLW